MDGTCWTETLGDPHLLGHQEAASGKVFEEVGALKKCCASLSPACVCLRDPGCSPAAPLVTAEAEHDAVGKGAHLMGALFAQQLCFDVSGKCIFILSAGLCPTKAGPGLGPRQVEMDLSGCSQGSST